MLDAADDANNGLRALLQKVGGGGASARACRMRTLVCTHAHVRVCACLRAYVRACEQVNGRPGQVDVPHALAACIIIAGACVCLCVCVCTYAYIHTCTRGREQPVCLCLSVGRSVCVYIYMYAHMHSKRQPRQSRFIRMCQPLFFIRSRVV